MGSAARSRGRAFDSASACALGAGVDAGANGGAFIAGRGAACGDGGTGATGGTGKTGMTAAGAAASGAAASGAAAATGAGEAGAEGRAGVVDGAAPPDGVEGGGAFVVGAPCGSFAIDRAMDGATDGEGADAATSTAATRRSGCALFDFSADRCASSAAFRSAASIISFTTDAAIGPTFVVAL